ncbi:MAG: hypothetical protein HZB39_04200 [Planctomycetes bacterium]|nr:hypothetical protein [Planctomycetota bacterium]
MKWFVAAVAFAAVVGLSIATAAIQVENVQRRARIAAVSERAEASRIAREAERIRFRTAARVDPLVDLWRKFESVMAERAEV